MHHTGEHILSSDTVQYLDKLRNDWDIKGVAISVVKMSRTTGKWETETLGFGEKDVDGNPVNDKVNFISANIRPRLIVATKDPLLHGLQLQALHGFRHWPCPASERSLLEVKGQRRDP
jgi:hypothetical protein